MKLCLVSEIKFEFTEMPVGGAAIDATGVPLPNETLLACKESDAVLLAAIGGFVLFQFYLVFTYVSVLWILLVCSVMSVDISFNG